MSPKASRNDLCSCGSNKKYKNCCGKKGIRLDFRLLKRVFLAVIIIAAAAWVSKQYIFVPDSEESSGILLPRQQPNRVQPLAPQPPGQVPEGKVWSPEHNHWHDAPATNADGETIFTPKAQPPGLPPPGKVWSYEHGHWHDSSNTGSANYTPGPPPAGPAPAGKVWSYEHGHWHNAEAGQTSTGTTVQPKKIQVGNPNLGDQ